MRPHATWHLISDEASSIQATSSLPNTATKDSTRQGKYDESIIENWSCVKVDDEEIKYLLAKKVEFITGSPRCCGREVGVSACKSGGRLSLQHLQFRLTMADWVLQDVRKTNREGTTHGDVYIPSGILGLGEDGKG